MKTLKDIFKIMIIGILFSGVSLLANAQIENKPVIAVLGVDSKGIENDAQALSNMVRLELEKANTYSVLDKFDVIDILKKSGIEANTCFGKTCAVNAGKVLNADKVITGNIERFGEKIIICLKLINVKSEITEQQDVTEYLNLQSELQKMIGVSVQKLLGIVPDKELAALLINYDAPINSPKTKANYSGPRIAFTYYFGDVAKILQQPRSEGGFDMYPAMFQFGWQQEIRYLSSGNFSGLVEILPMIGGLECGKFIPSLTFMNGFRMGKGNWEIAFGPSIKVFQRAEGFYDVKNLLGRNEIKGEGDTVIKWYRQKDYPSYYNAYLGTGAAMKRIDGRGKPYLSTSFIISFGKTFKSGYLNIPVNLYASIRKEGTMMGISCGFNVSKPPKNKNIRIVEQKPAEYKQKRKFRPSFPSY
jgi:hypothetical protein